MVRCYRRKTSDQWSRQDLLTAVTRIKNRTLNIADATKIYGISRATLYRHYKKFMEGGCNPNVILNCTPGSGCILTKVEEQCLEDIIIKICETGLKISPADIKHICFMYCSVNSVPNKFKDEKQLAGDDWYYNFLKRHPRVAESIQKTRSQPSQTLTKDDLITFVQTYGDAESLEKLQQKYNLRRNTVKPARYR